MDHPEFDTSGLDGAYGEPFFFVRGDDSDETIFSTDNGDEDPFNDDDEDQFEQCTASVPTGPCATPAS